MSRKAIIRYKKQYIGASSTIINFYDGNHFCRNGLPAPEELFFGSGKASRPGARRLFVTDTNVAALPCMKAFTEHFDGDSENILVVLPAGEEYKTIDSVLKIVKAAVDAALTRKDIFVGIGGGVITDMTAFAAAIFKRGARCEHAPTTLLAMVDAALGGKSGCDFDDYKNMTGAFMPAENLYVFPQFVQSLSEDQYRSGFAEAFKQALLFDKKLFEEIVLHKEKIKDREPDFVFRMIQASVKAKACVVQKDMTEKNIRMLLNFGHTFGHALETVAGLGKIFHGDAVAWGIGRALTLSASLGLCSAEYRDSVLDLIKYFGWDTEARPAVLGGKDCTKELISAMRRDKKNSSSSIRVILQKGLTKNIITEISDGEIEKCL